MASLRTVALGGLVVLGALAGCARGGYETSWTNDDAGGPIDLRGQTVATFLVIPSDDWRRAVETMMSERISKRGARGVPGYTVLTRAEMDDLEAARDRLAAQDVEAILVLRPQGSEQQAYYVPGRPYYNDMGYDTLWGYWSVWNGVLFEPGSYEIEQKVFVEALVFSVPRDKLLWGGVTSVNSSTDVGRMFDTLVTDTGHELRRAGILK